MAQHDYVIANASGASVRADINNMALAISSNNSGSSEPSTTYAYLWWLDSSANVLKLRNSANNAWITMPFSITANNTVDINGGAIDGTNIGASAAGTGAFTTLTASSNLSVDGGTIKLDGNYPTGTGNVALGDTALDSITSSGNYNSAVGRNSLTATTTGDSNTGMGNATLATNSTGANNTAVGGNALENATTADNNTAVGYASLNSNTTGADNVAVGAYVGDAITTGYRNTLTGSSAGGAITTGAYNTIFGWQAGDAITTADDNVLVGPAAGGAITTGHSNVAMGRNALLVSTTASNNTGIGHYALAANTTGENNIAIGGNALDANTTASNNTAVGRDALGGNTTGTGNTSVGKQSAQGITTGDENTFMGLETGTANVTMSTANKNTIIGAKCSTSSNNVDLNVVIGYNSTGAAGSDGYLTFGYNQNRTYIVMGNTSWSGTSDSRLKENVADHALGLGFVNALRPVTYNWKKKKDVPSELSDYYEDGNEDRVNGTNALRHGFIAQEVKSVMDSNSVASDSFNLWDTMADGTQALADGELIPILVKALQEADNKIDALTTRVAALEG